MKKYNFVSFVKNEWRFLTLVTGLTALGVHFIFKNQYAASALCLLVNVLYMDDRNKLHKEHMEFANEVFKIIGSKVEENQALSTQNTCGKACTCSRKQESV